MPNNNSGFTLIETLVYLGLFAILLAGVGTATYAVVEASGRDHTRITAQEEASFLLGKLNWALTGASSIQIPALGVAAPSLSVVKYVGTSPLIFDDPNANKLRLKEGAAGTATDLNSDAVKVINLTFTDLKVSGKQEGVDVKFTLRSTTPRGATIDQDFETIKYLR